MTEDDEDERLRALRAAWRSLPDEDPPDRGLGELMAAARAKADVMARPPWWRRILELVRRPPVLALATVAVLVAGAVLVGRDHDAMEAGTAPTPTSTPPPPPARELTPEATMPQALPRPTEHELDAPAPRPTTKRPTPAAHDHKQQPSVDKSVALPPPPKTGPSRPSPETSNADATAKVSISPEQESGAVPLALQLHAQSRSAAARGDCAAARLLAGRIAKQDSGYYRDHVASDATLGKCLATE